MDRNESTLVIHASTTVACLAGNRSSVIPTFGTFRSRDISIVGDVFRGVDVTLVMSAVVLVLLVVLVGASFVLRIATPQSPALRHVS